MGFTRIGKQGIAELRGQILGPMLGYALACHGGSSMPVPNTTNAQVIEVHRARNYHAPEYTSLEGVR